MLSRYPSSSPNGAVRHLAFSAILRKKSIFEGILSQALNDGFDLIVIKQRLIEEGMIQRLLGR